MPFPFSLSGTIRVAGVAVESATRGIERSLTDARAPLLRSENRIEFRRGPLFSRSGWDVLAPLSAGVVEVAAQGDGVAVSYRVTFTLLVWGAAIGVAIFFGPGLLGAPNLSTGAGLALLLFAWSWLVGGNYVITRYRLRTFLANAAQRPGVDRKRPIGV
jgi:hypothetical protein